MPVTLHTSAPSLTPAEIARWSAVPVAVAVDLVREAGQIDPALRPLRPAGSQPRLFGTAITVHCEAPDFGAVLQALDVIERGQVLVIDAGGYRDAAMIGDILSGHLRAKGVAGLVCDGAVRLVVLSAANARALIGEAEAKLAREAGWIEGLAAGTSAVEVFGLQAAIRG